MLHEHHVPYLRSAQALWVDHEDCENQKCSTTATGKRASDMASEPTFLVGLLVFSGSCKVQINVQSTFNCHMMLHLVETNSSPLWVFCSSCRGRSRSINRGTAPLLADTILRGILCYRTPPGHAHTSVLVSPASVKMSLVGLALTAESCSIWLTLWW